MVSTDPIISYANHAFHLHAPHYDSTVCARWTRETKHLGFNISVFSTTTGSPNWKNLVSWLKKEHSGEFYIFALNAALKSTKQQLQEEVIQSYFNIAFTMRNHPWEVLEAIIDVLRPGLSAIDGRWAQD
jgi:hypothetical protein